jgi:hypothetical protein
MSVYQKGWRDPEARWLDQTLNVLKGGSEDVEDSLKSTGIESGTF